MSPKMSFVLGLCLLCGFLAHLPTAFTLECYACVDYPGSSEPCDGSSYVQCESHFDSCMSLTATIEFYGMNHTTTVKNCSVSQYGGCNSSFVCGHVNSSVVAAGGSMMQCDLSCCHSDRCNGQGGPQPTTGEPQPPTGGPQPPTAGPDPQSRLKYYIETIQALLDQMEYIVDNDLGGHFSAREYKERVKRAISDVYALIANEGQQKRDAIINQLKKNAVELKKKLDNKRGRSKRRVAKSLRDKKREAKNPQLMREAMKTIDDSLARLLPKNR